MDICLAASGTTAVDRPPDGGAPAGGRERASVSDTHRVPLAPLAHRVPSSNMVRYYPDLSPLDKCPLRSAAISPCASLTSVTLATGHEVISDLETGRHSQLSAPSRHDSRNCLFGVCIRKIEWRRTTANVPTRTHKSLVAGSNPAAATIFPVRTPNLKWRQEARERKFRLEHPR